MPKNKFNKVVVLDTVIFYPEHETVLKELVHNPKIERVPLEYNQSKKEWELPENYFLPIDANIIIWPSSLPETFNGISLEIHEKLRTGYCYVEERLRENIPAQNLLNRVKDADCIITCWTPITDLVLENINPKAILTWTHEYEHRLNVKKANEKGIFTACVDDYGTNSVAELEFNMLLELIQRNKITDQKAKTYEDFAFGALLKLFSYYRKAYINEKNTRKGKFSHQFHKIGRSLKYYGEFGSRTLDEVIPSKLLEGKTIGILRTDDKLDYLTDILKNGFNANITVLDYVNSDEAIFYKLLSTNEFIIFDSSLIDQSALEIIYMIKKVNIIDTQTLPHFRETLMGKTIGVVGFGRIGEKVAKIAGSFGMRVLYSGNKKDDSEYELVELSDLLKMSNIISFNIKAHKSIELLTKEMIRLIKNGSYFINTSDGNAVNQEELTRRMLDNELYVGLDVYQGLPTTKTLCLDDDLNGKIKDQLNNHFLTYRAGWNTQESIMVKTYKLLGHMIKVLAE